MCAPSATTRTEVSANSHFGRWTPNRTDGTFPVMPRRGPMTNNRTTPAVAEAASPLPRAAVRVLAVVLTTLVVSVGLLSGTASAAGVGNPVLVSPTGTIAYHSAPNVSVNFSNAPLGDYQVYLISDDNQTYVVQTVSYTGV